MHPTRVSAHWRARLLACSALAWFAIGALPARAQSVTDAQIKALQTQIDNLQKTVRQLEAQQARTNAEAAAARRAATHAEVRATQIAKLPVKVEQKDSWFFRHKPGSALSFQTPGGEITAYGNIDVSLDVSLDGASKNVGSLELNGAAPPIGNFGWMPDISTNNSYLGR